MSPQLQQIFQDLNQLTPTERWQVIEYLIQQLKGMFSPSPAASTSPSIPSAQAILTATQGSWGHQTRSEIDTQLAQQRRQDWGE